MNKPKYTYEKITEDIFVTTEMDDGTFNKVKLKSVYDVFGVFPNYFQLMVHKIIEISEYGDSWAVTEKQTGMLIMHPTLVKRKLKTRDEAVDEALEEIKREIPSQEAADQVIQNAKSAMILKALNSEPS